MTKSDVALALYKRDYEQMRKENQTIDQYLKESSPIISEIDNCIFIYWEWITWFPFTNEGQKTLDNYLTSHSKTMPYKFIELSEDLSYAPIIVNNVVGEEDCDIFGIERKISLY